MSEQGQKEKRKQRKINEVMNGGEMGCETRNAGGSEWRNKENPQEEINGCEVVLLLKERANF